MTEQNQVQLYTNQYCHLSQRPIIALYEANIEFNLIEIPTDKFAEWIYDLSPQGDLPILKEVDGRIVAGWNSICLHLEKYPTIINFNTTEKIGYETLMNHCKTRFEPLVAHMLDDSIVQRSPESMKELLYLELEFIENNIEGPFFMGDNITWIDIHYWTIMEQFPLLNQMYTIEIPMEYKNVRNWLELLSRRHSFEKAKFIKDDYVKWFNDRSSASSISPVKYINTINNSLRNGVNQLLQIIEELDIYNNREHALKICTTFTSFDCVLREHTKSKVQLYFKSIEERDPQLVLIIHSKFEDEQQMLDDIHDLLTKVIYISNMKFQLSRDKQSVENDNSKEPLKSMIHWRLEKFETDNPPDVLRNDLIQKLKEFRDFFNENLEREENVLTEKNISNLFSPNNQLSYLAKRLICLSNESYFEVCYPWIIEHLPNDQVEFYIQTLYSAMPYQFTDIYHHLEETLDSNTWNLISAKFENSFETPLRNSPIYQQLCKNRLTLPLKDKKSNLTQNVVGKSNSEDLAIRFSDGPKKPRKRSKGNCPEMVEPDLSDIGQSTRPRGTSEFAVNIKFLEMRNLLNLDSPRLPLKRGNNITESKSDNFGFENRKSSLNNNNNNGSQDSANDLDSIKEDNQVPQNTIRRNSDNADFYKSHRKIRFDIWERYFDDNTKQPLSIFTLATKVIKARVIHLEEMAKRRHRLNNLIPLEEALEVLTYIVIQDLQADVALLPTLCKKKDDLAPIFKVYSMDHSVALKLINKITNEFIAIKGSDSLELLELSIDHLFEDIIQVTTLEKYFINKDESLIFPLISEYIPVHIQPQLTREILDISPPQYFTKMLPWVVKQLSSDDQAIFIETLRASLPKYQFNFLSTKIRKVLSNQENYNLFK